MARFDIYRTDGGALVLDVQTNLISSLTSRLVIPLIAEISAPTPIKRLHPRVVIEGENYILATHLMAAVPIRVLGRPVGDSLENYDAIVAAIDMIFLGF